MAGVGDGAGVGLGGSGLERTTAGGRITGVLAGRLLGVGVAVVLMGGGGGGVAAAAEPSPWVITIAILVNTTETDRSRRATAMTPPAHIDFTGGRRCLPKVDRRSPVADQGITTKPTGDGYLQWHGEDGDTPMAAVTSGIEA